MANSQRGEVSLLLGGKEYTLRPTFEALCELEARTRVSLPDLVMDLQMGNPSLMKLSLIIWSGIWGFNKESSPSINEVGEMVVTDGLVNVLEQGVDQDEDKIGPIVSYLVHGLTGGKKKEEGKAADPKAETKETK